MRAVTFSSSLNAWSLYVGCKREGIELRTFDSPRLLPIPAADPSPSDDAWLCLTEESSLKRALLGDLQGRFHPAEFPAHLLDDKLRFAHWLRDMGETPVPFSTVNHHDVSFPVIVKPRRSWHDGNKTPRGWVCRAADELMRLKQTIAADGFSLEDFFLQQWLEAEVLSVCGFADHLQPVRNLMCLVARVTPYTDGASSAAIVATVDDENGLIARATTILSTLRYTGPFELEFLRAQNRCYVLELNPRFWMQHGIFVEAGNGLIRRYFAIEDPTDRQRQAPHRILWIDGIWFWQSIFSFKLRVLKTVMTWIVDGYSATFVPAQPMALLAYFSRRVLLKLRRFRERRA